ncbi:MULTISPECIES: NYN domain-containing protein [Okeania]|uniref:NYN domain-containing protein n=1 Tax=Okeania hirsuta TaxID=1458930 RepID=A0A3N6PDY0_9CYAN|nr:MULTISPECIES: NYN domain-containing protein [Okeania]NET14417.1 NYN domain-containing protein [Okeania sp. SIO1H6]NES78050.1 NYN domain-containing protein [Okeania sp. SIO1H4]NET23020.1 NYN domain-containing protein [Okeania sp. SIO1H5]NET96502.1 NYN domain-containing protein [Okeania sp. SIO1H2]RQH18610.1 NYN domain-containing protein [Okeania hirsuta]
MSDNSGLLMTNNATAIKAISNYIYQTIVSIQQQHPEWINPKYKSIPWNNAKNQSTLTNKLTKGLSCAATKEDLQLKVINYLHILLTPEFINSDRYNALISQIDRFIYPEINIISSDKITNSQIPDFSTNGTKLVESGMAILLLDVENLHLDIETEKILVDICNYPIQIKVAFANWRSMGKKDEEFHQRGYQLIHVPPGKDSADLKMATVGASIFVNYPTAKEVLVCSSDRGLTHLGTTLQSHGLTVYQVRKYKNQITVLNSQTGESQVYAISVPDIPTIDTFIIQLQELIRSESEKIGLQWIKFSRISALYKETYKVNLKDVVLNHFPDQKSRQIFVNFPAYFAIHQPSEKSQTYVSIFNLFKPEQKSLTPPTDNGEVPTNITDISEITSQEIMEKVLVKIVSKLIDGSPNNYVPISNLGSEFHRLYGRPITKTIKRFQPSKKFPKYLELCSSLKLHQSEEGRWFVSLR